MFKNPNKRQQRLSLLFLVCLFFAASYALFYFLWAGTVSTDNAYTAADMADVCAATDGVIKAVHVVETQFVRAGDLLAEIDDMDANIEIERMKATLQKYEAMVMRSQAEYDRRKFLSSSGSTSKEEVVNAEAALKVAQADLSLAKAGLAQAELNLTRTKIHAPFDGIVAQRKIQLGQCVSKETRLLSVVPTAHIYVNANFKEGELKDVKVGQKATLTSDLYGKSVVYRGTVVGFSGGTGSAFAIIPAQNATGNWIKVIQRLPVRIELNQEDLIKHPLYVGLSMRAVVDTRLDPKP